MSTLLLQLLLFSLANAQSLPTATCDGTGWQSNTLPTTKVHWRDTNYKALQCFENGVACPSAIKNTITTSCLFTPAAGVSKNNNPKHGFLIAANTYLSLTGDPKATPGSGDQIVLHRGGKDAANPGRLFYLESIQSRLDISYLTLKGGWFGYEGADGKDAVGGLIYVSPQPKVMEHWQWVSYVSLDHSVMEDSFAFWKAGAIYGRAEVRNSLVRRNTAGTQKIQYLFDPVDSYRGYNRFRNAGCLAYCGAAKTDREGNACANEWDFQTPACTSNDLVQMQKARDTWAKCTDILCESKYLGGQYLQPSGENEKVVATAGSTACDPVGYDIGSMFMFSALAKCSCSAKETFCVNLERDEAFAGVNPNKLGQWDSTVQNYLARFTETGQAGSDAYRWRSERSASNKKPYRLYQNIVINPVEGSQVETSRTSAIQRCGLRIFGSGGGSLTETSPCENYAIGGHYSENTNGLYSTPDCVDMYHPSNKWSVPTGVKCVKANSLIRVPTSIDLLPLRNPYPAIKLVNEFNDFLGNFETTINNGLLMVIRGENFPSYEDVPANPTECRWPYMPPDYLTKKFAGGKIPGRTFDMNNGATHDFFVNCNWAVVTRSAGSGEGGVLKYPDGPENKKALLDNIEIVCNDVQRISSKVSLFSHIFAFATCIYTRSSTSYSVIQKDAVRYPPVCPNLAIFFLFFFLLPFFFLLSFFFLLFSFVTDYHMRLSFQSSSARMW